MATITKMNNKKMKDCQRKLKKALKFIYINLHLFLFSHISQSINLYKHFGCCYYYQLIN